MVDVWAKLDAIRQARLEEENSDQSTLSRELEAAGRQWASGVLHTGAALTGSESLREAARYQEEVAQRRLSRSALPQTWDDAEGASGVAGYVGHLAIQSLPYIAEFATGAVGAGRALAGRAISQAAARTAGGVAASYPSSTGAILSAQDDQAGEYDLQSALPLGALHAGANAVAGPQAWIARGLPRSAIQSRAGRAAAIGGTTAGGEAATEAFQTTLEQMGRKAVDQEYDILSDAAWRERREAAIAGGLLGGVFGTAAGAATRRQGAPQEVPQPAPTENEPVDLLALPAPGSGPTMYADELGNVSTRPDVRGQLQRASVAEGQGELFRPGEVDTQAPATPAGEIDPSLNPEPPTDRGAPAEQADLFEGTAAGIEAEVANEVRRMRRRLEQDYSEAGLIRELRTANKYKADDFVRKLASELSTALRSDDPDAAVELLNDYATRTLSIKRNNILRHATKLVERYEQRVAQIRETEQAGRQLVNEQAYRESVEAARRRTPKPGAEVRLPEPGDATEQQIRERNREASLEEQLQDVNRIAEHSIKKSSADRRREILRRVLDDPETVNPLRRFISELRKAGHRRGVTDAEARTIRRFEELRAAFAEELAPQEAVQEAAQEAAQEAPSQQTVATSGEVPAPTPQAPRRDRRQGELFTPTGRPTRAALGLEPERRRTGVAPAFQPARPQAVPEPERAPEAPKPVEETAPVVTEDGANRWSKMVDAALDRGRVDLEEAMRLYAMLDEGRIDEVKASLAKAARVQREAAGQTSAAPTPTEAVSKAAEKEARQVERLDRSVARRDDGDDAVFSTAANRERVANPTTTENLGKLKEMFMSPDRFDRLVKIYPTLQDALDAGVITQQEIEGRGPVQGFAKDGKVHLIAENIETGAELSVFLHELGGHIGLKNLIGPRNYLHLRRQVEKWAERDDNSVESRVGKWAVSRASGEVDPRIKNEEIVAYAIEGLVREGVSPTAMQGEAGNWFRRLWAAVKRALRKLGLRRLDDLTGQDLVDLAMGAADIELRGTYHGTGSSHRVFRERAAGSGTGVARYGWGVVYTADRRDIADKYRETLATDGPGNLMRIAHDARDSEFLLWDSPFSEQSDEVKEALRSIPELEGLLTDDIHGGDIYKTLADELGKKDARFQALLRDQSESGLNAAAHYLYTQLYRKTSKRLASAGIKGNKYLDRFSKTNLRDEPTYNYVLFNERDVVRVHSQPGGDRTQIRFSEAGPAPKRGSEIRNKVEELGISYSTTLRDLLKKGLYASAFGRDLRDMLARVLPSHRQYFEVMARKQATVGKLSSEVDQIRVDAYAIKGDERDKLNRFLMTSTRAQKWGFKPAWDGAPEVEIDPQMAREFRALKPETREIVKRIFEHGHKTLELKNQVVREAFEEAMAEVDQENLSPTEKRRIKDRILRQLNLYDRTFRGLKGPYAPLSRFGNHVTVAKSREYVDTERQAELGDSDARKKLEDLRQDPDHYAVFFSDTAGDAEIKKRELDATGKFAHTDRFEKEAYYRSIHEAPWTALLRLKNLVAEHAESRKDREMYVTRINGLLRDMYLHTLAEASARRHDLRRENVEGADPNMLRAFTSKGKADAHFIAALQHNGKVIEALTAMRSEAAADTVPGGVSKADRKRALNEVLARHTQGLELDTSPLGGLQDKAMALTSFHMLATMPRYYIQNLLQTPMISAPTLAGRYGMGKSWSELIRAYQDMAQGFGTMRETASGKYDLDKLKITPDERAMLEHLRSTGLLDVGLQYDLGYWESTDEKGPSAAVAKVNHFFRTVARQVEVVNRVSTALAAYRLERARNGGQIDPNTGTDNAALRVADDIVSQTHGDYSYLNKSRFFRALPKMVVQFRTYQMIQLSLIARYLHQAFKGATPEERAIGRRTMAWILGQHAVVTGALGLPAVQAVAYVMAAVFGDDDEPVNGERFLRKAIGDTDLANLLLKGVPAGMGLDMSRYIGMGEATSLMPYTDINIWDRQGYAETVVGMMGPFVSGVLPNVADGLGYTARGDYYKGIELMMPTGIRSGMRALRIANEGMTNRRGDQLLSPEEISIFDAAMQAFGFETTKFQELRRRRDDLYEYENYFRERASTIKHQYVKAVRNRDMRRANELKQDWQRLQQARVRVGFKAQPLANLLKAPAEQIKRERATRAGVQFNRSNQRFVEQSAQ